MLTKFVFAVAILVSYSALTWAEDLSGVITKIDGTTITFSSGEKGEPKTYDLAKDIKVFRYVTKVERELDPAGLQTAPLPNLPKGGAFAVIKVVDGKVTEISLPGKPRKK